MDVRPLLLLPLLRLPLLRLPLLLLRLPEPLRDVDRVLLDLEPDDLTDLVLVERDRLLLPEDPDLVFTERVGVLPFVDWLRFLTFTRVAETSFREAVKSFLRVLVFTVGSRRLLTSVVERFRATMVLSDFLPLTGRTLLASLPMDFPT